MPAYGNPASGGEDLYSDSPDASASPTAAESEDEGGSTSILPKDFFQGKDLSPGTICEVKIERVHDDSVEVSYVPHAAEEEAPVEAAAPPAPDSELAEMMA